jgi:hypothetical protein
MVMHLDYEDFGSIRCGGGGGGGGTSALMAHNAHMASRMYNCMIVFRVGHRQ